MDKLVWLHTVCQKNGLTISDSQLDLIQRYVSLLLNWNRKINLISRRDESNVWERHILHSIAMLFKLHLPTSARALDLGAGGGLPGVPIKIFFGALQLTCLESIRKKTVALENIVQQLSLSDVRVTCGRAERLGKEIEFRSQFDYVFCRAVGPLSKVVRWSVPFLKRSTDVTTNIDRGSQHRFPVAGGSLIAWKGGELESELNVARKLELVRSVTVIPLVFHGSEMLEASEKQLVIVAIK